MRTLHYRLFVLIFTLSGFAGLIYESIWSHYMQLLLGHAAYAQTLVLVIFMGGMAAGSKLAANMASSRGNLLMLYAMVEGGLGICALVFHKVFLGSTSFLLDTAIPHLATPFLIDLAKWSLGALLILPQSVLLGMTFPLMCAFMLRHEEKARGKVIATLYFCNSLGAAVGVLASGFWLMNRTGLPGTILTAGLINAGIALCAWGVFKRGLTDRVPTPPDATRPQGNAWWRPLLIFSALTGLSSFIYEIAWLRMLGMVLGSTTQSFELMLSAFILGLALGGLWLRKRIDHVSDLLGFLAAVQILMGALALLSMAVYGQSFEAMQWLLEAIQRSPGGYVLYLLLSNLLVLIVMLPATFCAGMTLPLITCEMLRRGAGEKSIGHVYAANTVGAILGVLFAVHIGMPMLGLKGAMMAGAVLDIVIGFAIVFTERARYPAWQLAGSMALGIGAAAATLVWVKLDPYQMASGVYRYGQASLPSSTKMLFNKDGKTATINVREVDANSQTVRIISTNGKPDASINMRPEGPPAVDEITEVMLAALPLALRPDAQVAANIGMGSGLTSSTLLSSSRIKQVDTVEIEAAVFEGANSFRPRTERVYADPRSHLYIEDAKTFFASHGTHYDIIVSEPSNPWVSGVASLFTDEFYRQVRRYLKPGGLYVQWLHIYEIDTGLVASVMKALDRNFPDYVVYLSDDGDMLIAASLDQKLSAPDGYIFDQPLLAAELDHVGISNLRDLELHRVGNKGLLRAFFDIHAEPVNSDYFPYLDLHANRSRFLNQNAQEITALPMAPLPLLRWLDVVPRWDNLPLSKPEHTVATVQKTMQAEIVTDILTGGAGVLEKKSALPLEMQLAVETVQNGQNRCASPEEARIWIHSVRKIFYFTLSLLSMERADQLVNALGHSACASRLTGMEGEWLQLLEAMGRADQADSAMLATHLLQQMDVHHATEEDLGYAVAVAMTANLAMDKPREALKVWDEYAAGRWRVEQVNIYLQLLYAMASRNNAEAPAITPADCGARCR